MQSLQDVLPLSSQFLLSSSGGHPTSAAASVMSGANQQSSKHPAVDLATLAADNHALLNTVQQQRFKLKV